MYTPVHDLILSRPQHRRLFGQFTWSLTLQTPRNLQERSARLQQRSGNGVDNPVELHVDRYMKPPVRPRSCSLSLIRSHKCAPGLALTALLLTPLTSAVMLSALRFARPCCRTIAHPAVLTAPSPRARCRSTCTTTCTASTRTTSRYVRKPQRRPAGRQDDRAGRQVPAGAVPGRQPGAADQPLRAHRLVAVQRLLHSHRVERGRRAQHAAQPERACPCAEWLVVSCACRQWHVLFLPPTVPVPSVLSRLLLHSIGRPAAAQTLSS